MSVQTKQEYVQATHDRYRGARRRETQRILDEFCTVTRQHRKHAIRLLDGPGPGGPRPPRSRDVQYERGTIDALQTIWEAARYPWSVRLKALLPLWLPWARRRLHLRPAVERGEIPADLPSGRDASSTESSMTPGPPTCPL